MANPHLRWSHGNTKPVLLPPPLPETVVAIGDLILKTTVPAAVAADAANFVGVAMQQSRVGDVQPIRSTTAGVYNHPCTPDVFKVGDLLAIAGPQLLVKTTDPALCVGIVDEDYPTPVASVQWKLKSVVFAGT